MAKVSRSIIIKGKPADIYPYWANFQNFPSFMEYIQTVTLTGPNMSHWILTGPAGIPIDWQAEMTCHELNKRIAWNSKDKAGFITTSGQVTFNELPQEQTQINATIQYVTPAGKAGEIVAKLFANPEERLETDLRNFKQMVEGRL